MTAWIVEAPDAAWTPEQINQLKEFFERTLKGDLPSMVLMDVLMDEEADTHADWIEVNK